MRETVDVKTTESDIQEMNDTEYKVLKKEVKLSLKKIFKLFGKQKKSYEDYLLTDNLPVKRKRCNSYLKQRSYQDKYMAGFSTISRLLRMHHENRYKTEILDEQSLKICELADTSNGTRDFYCFDAIIPNKHYSLNSDVEEFAKNNERIKRIVDNSRLIRLKHLNVRHTPIRKIFTRNSEHCCSDKKLMKKSEIDRKFYKKSKTHNSDYRADIDCKGEFPRIKLEKFTFSSEHKFKKKKKVPVKHKITREFGKFTALVM